MFVDDTPVVATGKRLTLDFSSTGFLVQSLGITLLYNSEGSVDKDFDKGQISLLMKFASYFPIGLVRRYERSDRNTTCICEQLGDLDKRIICQIRSVDVYCALVPLRYV